MCRGDSIPAARFSYPGRSQAIANPDGRRPRGHRPNHEPGSEGDGHSVQWAGDVAEGLRLAAAQDFDLLLCDVGLPDGSGWDLMRSLRLRGSRLHGIVLSGHGQAQDIQQSYDAGFKAHLIKPLTLQALRDAIGKPAALSPGDTGEV